MILIDGKKLSQEILSKIKIEVEKLPFQPVFCDVLVGEDKVSKQYVDMKMRAATAVGILFHQANFSSSISTEELIKEIKILNKIPNMCGLIIQLPLPTHINIQAVLDAVDPEIDVDCLGSMASQKFYEGANPVGFPTALACLKLIESLNLNLQDKKIVVLGQGNLVGKPVTALFRFHKLTPFVVNSQTKNKEEIVRQADLIVSGIGKGKYLTGDMIKKGVVIIDAGTSESNSGIVGDVDLNSVRSVAGYVSPVPGGVGPMTVAMLLNNVLTVARGKEAQKSFIKS
jgi:methylenetetrahydrofolate dehydrogenase (NADP+) / methenyltetrahydrofolate cyclohydrolase